MPLVRFAVPSSFLRLATPLARMRLGGRSIRGRECPPQIKKDGLDPPLAIAYT